MRFLMQRWQAMTLFAFVSQPVLANALTLACRGSPGAIYSGKALWNKKS